MWVASLTYKAWTFILNLSVYTKNAQKCDFHIEIVFHNEKESKSEYEAPGKLALKSIVWKIAYQYN